MHRKFDVRRYLTAFFIGIFAVVGSIVAIDAPANAALGDTSEIDYSLSLGSGQAIYAQDANSLDLSTNLTFEAWYKVSTNDTRVILNKENAYEFGIDPNGKFMYAFQYGGAWDWNNTGIEIPTGQWVHLGFTKANTTSTLYLNGQSVWSQTGGKTTTNGTVDANPSSITNQSSLVVIGGRANVNSGSGSLSGQASGLTIDEVKLWNVARSQADIASDMHNKATSGATGLAAYWNFNEGNTSNSSAANYDRSGQSNNLQFFGTPTASNGNFVDVKTTTKLKGQTIVSFPRTYLPGVSGWTVPAGMTKAKVLVVGGGGGGGSRHAGGGGAGEVGSYSLLTLTPTAELRIKVGAGGLGYNSTTNNGVNSGGSGQSSMFGPDEFLGGGGGQGGSGGTQSGGSGGGTAGAGIAGGAAINGTGTTSNSVLTRYATAGGSGSNNGGSAWFGGGGGGATGAGSAASTSAAGSGGQGFSSSITGSPLCFAAGGGGGSSNSANGNAGSCSNGATSTAGAGTTNTANNIANHAAANSGSGGGGGGLNSSDDQPGGNGGSGIIIVVYGASGDTAFDFVTTGDNKYVATNKQVIPSKSSFTFETWVKARSLASSGWNDIFRQESTSSNYYSFEVAIYSGQLQVINSVAASSPGTFNTVNAVNSNEKLSINRWTHIAVSTDFTVSGSNTIVTMNVYMDGQLTSTWSYTVATSSLSTLGSAGVSIGGLYNENTSTRNWDGQIDQMKIWNGALTQAEIAKSMHAYSDAGVISSSGSSLRAFYDFNSISTSSLSDQTGNGYDFAAKNANATATDVATISSTSTSNIYKFTRSYLTMWGGWISPVTTSRASALSVGGGGGGGENVGAGGSGGGFAYVTNRSLTDGYAYDVTVGQGGVGGLYYANHSSDSTTASQLRDGGNGQNTSFGLSTALVGTGGTGGQTYWADNKCGGATLNAVASVGVSGTGGDTNLAGGSGGSGFAGGSANGNAGSAGNANSISGASVTYGGGGGGGGWSAYLPGAGGSGGGGSGGTSGTNSGAGVQGSANTGGGGGGGAVTCGAGASGGSGVLIVSVKTAYTVTFDVNGGTGSLTSQNINIGSSVNLTSNSGSISKSGYTFAGWSTNSSGTVTYADGASITPSADTTLYAQWLSNSSISGNQYVGQVLTAAALTTPTPGGAATSYTYQWQSALTSGGAYANITGATSSTFTITCAEVGKYIRVIVVGVYSGNINSSQVVSTATAKIAASASPVLTNDSLVLYLDAGNACNTSTSTSWKDLSGNGNDATLGASTAAPTYASTEGGTYTFDAAQGDYAYLGTKTMDFSNGMSASAWVKFGSTAAWQRVFDFGNGPGQNNIWFGRKDATSQMALEIFNGTTSRTLCETDANAIVNGTWEHWAFTLSATDGCRIYKNGTQVKAVAGYTSVPDNISRTSNLIGKSNWQPPTYTDVNFTGAMGDLAVYTSTLTGSQISANYTAQRYVAVATPTFSSHPASITKSAGETATFSVTAATADAGTLSYQWEVSANNGTNWLSVSGGTGATTNSYTTPTLVSADLGKQYRVVVTNTLNGNTATATSNAATLTIGLDKINVAFDELNYDFANVLHVVGTNGKTLGNKVLFLNVTTKNGIQVDSLVTTEELSGATIDNYESGTGAGGANSYFQADISFSAANGFAKFKFDFYKHGVAGAAGNPCTVANPTCSGATKVVIQNVNVSAIDIDYNQWNDFTAAESYTLAGNTKLKECPIPNTGTCTARVTPTSFPADMRFQGSPDTARANDPVDMAIVTYANIETFRIKFGRSASGTPNYFGVAFKALDWGTTTPQTTGGTNYTISYDVNGASSGSQAGTHVGAAGSSFTVLSAGTAVRTGYTFAGWATTANATTANYTGSSKVTMPGSNLTLYAVWTPIKYTLTYDANGGTAAPAAGSYDAAASVTLSSSVPTRTGYVFGGWNTTSTGGTNYASGASYSMPAANTTLYAKWTIANGTLAYNANNGTTTEASVTAAGNTTTTIASGSNTSRSGYDFVGWNSKADGTGTSYAVGSTFTLSANVTTTIYAQWTLSKYTLVFNVNGGVGTPQSQSYVQGATTTMPVTNPTRAGYTFAGWNSQADGNGTAYNGSFLMPGSNLTLYAKWTPITYSVIYNNNSSTYSGATGSVTDATAYTAAQTATVSAGSGLTNVTGGITYRFIGWNTNAAGTGNDYMPGDTISMPASNITLYAMWLDASIEIAYNANGGTGAPANTNATTGQSFTISATQPTRSGYTFGGWLLQDNSPTGGPYNASGTFTPNSNEILVAQWTAVNYTVTYNSDGGSTAPSQLTNKHIDDTINVDSTAPTKAGYTFLGWKDAAGNVYPAGGTFNMPAGNVVLTAQWQGNAYTLTYDANGGAAAPAAETRNYSASANLSATQPTRTGYTFQGWNTLVGGTGTAYNSSASYTMPNSNTTLFAQWSANSYVLAYNTQGGSTAPASANKDYNASVTVSGSTPTRTGYSFAGWNTAAAGTGTTYLQSATFNMPDANVTLYAQWTKTAFTLYYNTNGGQGVFSSQPVKYSESVTVDSTTPTKTGYTFSGWNTAANGSGFDYNPMGIFTLNVEANVTLYAKWTAVSYTVAYNANSGSGAPSGGSYNYGATVTTANKGSIARIGYRFTGWNDRADGSGTTYIEAATFNMPADNVILYAQWIDSSYQIAYNANGGSGGPDGAIAADGSTYTIDPIQPVRPGYTFGGWKLADGTPTNATLTSSGTNSFTVAGDELLVAQWTIKTITVTYDLNGGGGTTPNADSGNYNSNITLASSSGISRANFQFVGWSTTPDGTGPTYVDGGSFKLPTDDVILYAKWAPIYYIIEYNPAGGTGEPADQFATPSTTVALATQEPTKAGYEFEKWTEVLQGTDFTPGASLTMPSSNVVLVANYTVKAAGVPGSGSGSNTGVIDPGTKPISKPKQLVLSVYFKGDSPVLIPRTKLALQKLAKLAKSYGRANNITIYGRVKETNDKSYDARLSKARANNVAAYLKKFGVIGVFKVYAKGISPENTWKSRRVDMKLWWAK